MDTRSLPQQVTPQVGQSPPLVACWGASEGAAGMANQVRGVAAALGVSLDLYSTVLRYPWRWFSPNFIPWKPNVFVDPTPFTGEPRLVVTCGRQGSVAALAWKRLLQDRVFTVHIQDAKVSPQHFDLVCVPEHDDLRGPNVITTLGSVHHISPARLAEARATGPRYELERLGPSFVTVLIGGPTRIYGYTDSDYQRFSEQLQRLSRDGVRLAILPSRRSQAGWVARLQQEFGRDHYVWDLVSPNPYCEALALCSHMVVTCDSVSMISEAAATEKPLYIAYQNERRSPRRLGKFHRSMEAAGIARPFDGTLSHWTYKSPDPTAAVAAEILARMKSAECLAG
jgi:uncharacterized protein